MDDLSQLPDSEFPLWAIHNFGLTFLCKPRDSRTGNSLERQSRKILVHGPVKGEQQSSVLNSCSGSQVK